jgi:EAL domain-containing protein (putative c-di-GMP-specific phosphodiesterase class I)/CheY-like chemotaxis protein
MSRVWLSRAARAADTDPRRLTEKVERSVERMHTREKQHLGRVLVVDDDAAMRRVCSRVLGHEGWDVVAVDGGKAALTCVREATPPFDCVLSDVHMPEVDGWALIAALRRQDDDLPVLLMTADPSLDGAVRAIDHGAVSYLSKPFNQETLAEGVARAARRHGAARQRRRSVTEGAMRDAGERFERALALSWMAFQPIVDVTTGQTFAYEALVRTDEESLQRVDVLIATAERLGRIPELGRTVRGHVARAAPGVPDGVLLFVNVHGLELTDEDLFGDGCALAPIADRVVLEITERVGLDAVAGPARVEMLRKRGYRIAVDDLGAGYAALGALATLEPEIVKLDMSLVRDIDRHPRKLRVVGAIATLCRELGSRVVAEGVETTSELRTLREAGIELIQGYLLARPSRELLTPRL